MSAYISPTAPIIGPTGISAPSYAQALTYLQNQYYAIFGADAYLEEDSQDGQLLAVFAQAITDANAAILAVYASMSPATGVGVGLSSNVQINGLTRLVPTASTASVTLGGTANITITNGQLIDPLNNTWSLPTTVTIGTTGTVVTTATCNTPGAVTFAGAFNINTPTYGWQSVVTGAITVGQPVETDAALRLRQAASVSLPSLTVFEGIVAAIETLPGIGRVRGIENNTAVNMVVQGGGPIPANNLCFIVENGGTFQSSVFQAIFSKITPGIPTYVDPAYPGYSYSQTVTDANGSSRLIKFMAPIESSINTYLTVTALNGWSPATTGPLIAAAVRAYLAALPIGSNVSLLQGILPAALNITPATLIGTFAVTAITIQKNSGSIVASDIQLNYNEAASASLTTVKINGIAY